ncbi:hypothetical protein [Paenibacillus odorifer]|uniref:Uncharacterized protein n=1 Tax=Paenibacillus odorifer TaxID=189426 RepID=A0AAD0KL32_9BACL|nr:hypothetical protein [Paenibacillus odorifer]AWV35184.1 hypothetical protein CD191_22505 [Paenibacillus odorifer]
MKWQEPTKAQEIGIEPEAWKGKCKNKVWTVKSEPWDLCGSEVVLLEGFNSGFATEYLKKLEG